MPTPVQRVETNHQRESKSNSIKQAGEAFGMCGTYGYQLAPTKPCWEGRKKFGPEAPELGPPGTRRQCNRSWLQCQLP